ncbi:MAG: PAS domain-containing protein [Alphaproteobacteria bacterium]
MRDLAETIQTAPCRAYFNAWQSWRGENLVPVRSQVHIEDIAPHLQWLAVLEVISLEEIIFRLAGTGLTRSRGYDYTGMNYVEMCPVEDRSIYARTSLAIVRHPVGRHFFIDFELENGKHARTELLSLPVYSDDPEKPPQIFNMRYQIDHSDPYTTHDPDNLIPLADEARFVDIGAGFPPDHEALNAHLRRIIVSNNQDKNTEETK